MATKKTNKNSSSSTNKKKTNKSSTKTKKKIVKKPVKIAKKSVVKKTVKKSVVKKPVVKKTVKKPIVKKAVKKLVNKKAVSKKPTTNNTNKKTSSKIIYKRKIIEKPELKIKTYHLRKPIPEEKYFVFVNGHRVKNVKELADIMDQIEQAVFDHHVNPDRNDFYNWVKEVFDDVELAEKLLGVKNPKHLQLEIFKHVTNKAFED